MKKRILFAIAIIFGALMLSACSEATVHGKMEVYDNLSGTKTLTIRVPGDQEPLGGRDYTAGNNTAFMLTRGEDLVAKLYDLCDLKEDIHIEVCDGATDQDPTYIIISFDFDNMADYNAKARTMAGKNADGWIDAVLSQDGASVTVTEAAGNIKLLYLDMLEKYFNDFDCYPIYEYGPNTQSQVIPHGITFEGDDLYAFSWWIVPTDNEIVIGESSQKETYFVPEEDYEFRMDLSGLATTATGEPGEAPVRVVPETLTLGETKKDYMLGEEFVPFAVTVIYSDGSKKDITVTKAEISGFDSAKPGTQTVTVSIEGLKASFEVTVAEPVPEPSFPTYGWFILGGILLMIVGGTTAVAMWKQEKKKNAK